MMRTRRLILVLVLFATSLPGALAADRGRVSVWYVDSLVKVFPHDAPGTHRLAVAEFRGARNQHVNIQLALRTRAAESGLVALVTPLRSGNGHDIAGAQVQQVGYVVVGSNTPDVPREELVGEAPSWYPDELLPLPMSTQAGQTRSFWITLKIPRDAAPGTYEGWVEVLSGERVLAKSPFHLKVVAAEVPDARTLKVTNWFTLDDKISKQFFHAPMFSDDWWTLVGNVARVMAEHRQNVVITPLETLVQPRAEGTELRYDFTNFDRWVETFQKAGAIGVIEGSHLLGREYYDAPLTVPATYLEGGKAVRQSLPIDDPRVEPFLVSFLKALNAHLEAKGWKSIYVQHVLDEAHGTEPPYYARVAALVHECLPGVQTIDAVDAAQMPEALKSNCDLWVPQLGRFDEQMDLLQQRIAGGHEVWFYTCLYPRGKYMNRLMDFPLIKVRLLHWLDFRYGFTGFLHWGGNYWTPDPVRDTQPVIDNNSELLPSGDAFVYYPDPEHRSLRSSIRLETMLAGIEDYELLHALKGKDPAEAERLARKAVPSLTDYVRDPAAFRKIERELLEAAAK